MELLAPIDGDLDIVSRLDARRLPPTLHLSELASTYTNSDHTISKMMGGTFTPTTSTVEVDVQINSQLVGVGHESMFFAWNQTATGGSDLMTGQGFAATPHVAGTSVRTLGPLAGPGNIASGGRRFRITGLTPGTVCTWEVEVGATGYYGAATTDTLPYDLTLGSSGKHLYVANFTSNTVQVFETPDTWDDAEDVQLVDTWTANSAIGICASTDGSKIYVADYAGDVVTERDSDTGEILRTFSVPDPHYMVASATTLYVTRHFNAGNFITPVTLSNGAVGTPIALAGAAGKPVISGLYLYVTTSTGNNVTRITMSNNATTTLATGASTTPVALATSSDGSTLWVLEQLSARAREIATSTFAFTGNLTTAVGSTSTDIALSPSGKSLYVVTGATTMNLQTFILPLKSSTVRYESSTVGKLARVVVGPEGNIYALQYTDASRLHFWHGAKMTVDPTDAFWGSFAQVMITEVAT
jgi:6-phosphogluconolactonase (cycloisomerase 2 family)